MCCDNLPSVSLQYHMVYVSCVPANFIIIMLWVLLGFEILLMYTHNQVNMIFFEPAHTDIFFTSDSYKLKELHNRNTIDSNICKKHWSSLIIPALSLTTYFLWIDLTRLLSCFPGTAWDGQVGRLQQGPDLLPIQLTLTGKHNSWIFSISHSPSITH